MSHRKPALYLVTVRTPSSVSQDIIEARGLDAAANSGVIRHRERDGRARAWTPGPGRTISDARLLSLKSETGSIQVTAETLSA